MAGRRILADTSLFVEHLRARDKTTTTLYSVADRYQVETVAVVVAEVLYGARTLSAEEHARSLLRPFPVHPFTLRMAERQSALIPELRKRNRLPDIRDMMIAVSALVLDLPLATLNRSHFVAIPGLTLVE